MKTFASTHSHISKKVKEHSPIYDLEAYLERQRKLKQQKTTQKFCRYHSISQHGCHDLFYFIYGGLIMSVPTQNTTKPSSRLRLKSY